MGINFTTLQDEVKRRATMNQSGTTFDTAIKNTINFALFRIAREAPWRSLRRKTTFNTVTSYTTGTGTAAGTSGSTVITASSANFLADDVQIDRKIKLGGSGTYYYIKQITGESSLVIDQNWAASTTTAMTMEILPQEIYNLPIQAGHRLFMWHEGFGYPFKMNYITDQDFYQHGVYLTIKYIPTHYRMWGEDMTIEQLRQPSIITLASSSTSDTSIPVTVFGVVSGYPDFETISTDSSSGATATSGNKIFSSIERVVKGSSTTGRLSVTANGGTDNVAVLPVGDTTTGIRYRKIGLYPLPNKTFPIWVQYYKDPYRLVNTYDVHEMGEEFDEAIILLATAKMKAEQNIAEADRMFQLYMEELQSLKRTNVDKLDWYPALRRPRQSSSDSLVAPNLLYRQAGSNFGPSSRF